jgi:hypothetical protein
MHNFTQDDLLLYLYNETSASKSAQIKTALETDWALREQFEELSNDLKNLEPIKLSPSSRTMENILNYAEKAVSELSAQA